MSFSPGFKEDVFISYSQIDNQSLTEGQKGWISHFHRGLEIRLAQLLGAEPALWRDKEGLQGNKYFEDEILAKIIESAILVSVITPRYLNSDWCRRESQEFYRNAESTGGIRIQNRSRIFKVIKTPVEGSSQPPEMQGLLSYDFFSMDAGKAREFDPQLGPEATTHYLDKLNDLAYDISELLKILKGATSSAPPVATIYLAETTSDLRDVRDNIRRDLLHRGYAVLPDRALSTDAADFKEQVAGLLDRSSLSVHLVGQRYGIVPEGETLSNVWLQHDLAMQRGKKPNFARLIWMPVGLQTADERQQKLIDFLLNDPSSQDGAELLQTKVEDLKTVIEDKLAAGKSERQPQPRLRREGPIRVYVICDPLDLEGETLSPLERYLFDHGYETILAYPGDDVAQAREEHLDNLRLCQACLIYYGKGNELWLRTKLNDCRKILDSRAEPVLARAIYLAPPETDHKRRFQTREALVLHSDSAFSPEALAPFLEAMRDAQTNGKSQ